MQMQLSPARAVDVKLEVERLSDGIAAGRTPFFNGEILYDSRCLSAFDACRDLAQRTVLAGVVRPTSTMTSVSAEICSAVPLNVIPVTLNSMLITGTVRGAEPNAAQARTDPSERYSPQT